jgi:hypothetical protein
MAEPTPDQIEAGVELVAMALASRQPYHRHGQRCPVWTGRPSDVHGLSDRTPTVAELDRCDCWIMADARKGAAAALAALTVVGWHPSGQCIRVDVAALLESAETGDTREEVIARLEAEWRARGWAPRAEVAEQIAQAFGIRSAAAIAREHATPPGEADRG